MSTKIECRDRGTGEHKDRGTGEPSDDLKKCANVSLLMTYKMCRCEPAHDLQNVQMRACS